jgi:hypothetical protein
MGGLAPVTAYDGVAPATDRAHDHTEPTNRLSPPTG